MTNDHKTAPPSTTPPFLWLSGDFKPWNEATVHITAMMWSSISAVFEGIRGYWNEEQQQLHIFRLDEHIDRLFTSMKLMRMTPEISRTEIKTAVLELLKRNDLREDGYISPFAFFGSGIAGYQAANAMAPEILVTTRPVASFLGTDKTTRCCISTWQRISDNVMPPRAKCIANYQNSRLVATEAALNGYDDGIILNQDGKVSEGGYACIFIVRNGIASTPPISAGILESITRESCITLFREQLGVEVVERSVDRTELYVADEAFLCGTFAEIKPIVSVDQYDVGNAKIGPLTGRLQELFEATVRGKNGLYPDWRSSVSFAEEPAPA